MKETADPPADRAGAYDRPNASFDWEGQLEVRASAALSCRRALWYAATGHDPAPPDDAALTVLETGRALEPVVLRAMGRDGWEITPGDTARPTGVVLQLTPVLKVTGHPDATGTPPLFGEESVIEVKTRGPSAFKRWQVLGAERSHPDSVAQAALYTYGLFGEARDAVIAVMDTGDRAWDHEVIQAERVKRALERTREWLTPLGVHHATHGADPKALPERDFEAGSWRCNSCPFLATCLPGDAEEDAEALQTEEPEVSDEEAREALTAYVAAREALREPEGTKRQALDTLKAWMCRQGSAKAEISGHTVSLVRSTRYAVDHKRLNALLDAETRKEIVTEQTSESVRIN
ncbi:MAG: hypothetical protein F4081_00610 [Dehalococcoidia bacterium]|nr:hypothetical protein [Dehalococcoidia bacterium]